MIQQRNTETKTYIKNSLIKLLKEKEMEDITVSDITRTAGVNRGTFYLHYLDKYDLIKQLVEEMTKNLEEILLADEEAEVIDDPLEIIPYQTILNALLYVKEEVNFIDALIKNGFEANLKQILGQLITKKIENSEYLKLPEHTIPPDYALEIIIGTIMSVILLWIKKGTKESPEFIAQIIDHSKQHSPYELLFSL